MMINKSKIIFALISASILFTLYAVPSPCLDTMSEDRYSPSAQALGMGGSFANI